MAACEKYMQYCVKFSLLTSESSLKDYHTEAVNMIVNELIYYLQKSNPLLPHKSVFKSNPFVQLVKNPADNILSKWV
jgi:hypothetical protein